MSVEAHPTVSVLILNWNGRHYLEEFLPSLFRTDYPNFEVVVADNASSDDSLDFLRTTYPQVRLIEFDHNHGFAGGNNLALEHIDTPYTVLLNSDVELTPGWLAPLVARMESDSRIAAAQPKVRWQRHRELFEYAGAAGGFMDRLCFPFCRGRFMEELEEDDGQYDDAIECFWATGCCMMLRKTVIDELGLFDGKFFAHHEEIDFCWRAKNAGYTIVAEPAATVYHVGGGTLPKGNPRKTFYNFRNSLMMNTKNLPLFALLTTLFMRLFVIDVLAAWQFLLSGKPKGFWAVARAHWSYFGHLPYLCRARKRQQQGAISQHTGGYRGTMLWAFFVRGKRKFSQLSGVTIHPLPNSDA